MRYLANALVSCLCLVFCYFKPDMWLLALVLLLLAWQEKEEGA